MLPLVMTAEMTEPDPPTLDLPRYVPALLTFISNKLSRSASVHYQRQFGVTVTEWRIMALLAIEPGIPAARICHVIGFDKGPVSRSLALMQKRGLVTLENDLGDARRLAIRLSAEGRALHDRILAVALDREAQLLSCFTPDQREALIALLTALHDNLPTVTQTARR